MGHEHIRNLALVPGAEIVGIADPDPQSRFWARSLLPDGVPEFEDYRTLLAEVAAIGSLINPYGIGLWFEAVSLPVSTDAWQPLILRSYSGVFFALSLLAVVAAARLNRTPIRSREFLLVVWFAILAGLHQPLIVWYLPVVLYVLLPRFARVAPPLRRASTQPEKPLSAVDFRYSLITALAIWTVFALSPASTPS